MEKNVKEIRKMLSDVLQMMEQHSTKLSAVRTTLVEFEKSQIEKVKLDRKEVQVLEENSKSIQSVLNKNKIDIKEIIGLVSEREVEGVKQQVMIRFSEGTASQMNMVAFD